MRGITNRERIPFVLVLLAAAVACRATAPAAVELTPSRALVTATSVTATAFATTPAPITPASPPTTALPAPTNTPPAPTPAATATPTATYAGPGCLRPPDDYSRVEIDGETLNARTLWMLQQAAALYDGPGDLLRVTQGSYTTGETSSFDTHAGGGAVDISIRNPANPAEVLWDETDAMVLALRRAGFAAWYRAPGDLGPGSPAHLHAVAIGDRELSAAAKEQLAGPGGYFRGFDGLPPEYGGPHPDPHGGPILCPWMVELGYVK